MSDGNEFHVRGAATEKARRASSVRVLGTDSSGAADERSERVGTAVCIRSLRYAGAEDDIALDVVFMTITAFLSFHCFCQYSVVAGSFVRFVRICR